MARNPRAPNDIQLLPGQFDRRHDADIGRAGCQPVGALGRQREREIEQIALLAMQHAPHQRDCVQIVNGANAGL